MLFWNAIAFIRHYSILLSPFNSYRRNSTDDSEKSVLVNDIKLTDYPILFLIKRNSVSKLFTGCRNQYVYFGEPIS